MHWLISHTKLSDKICWSSSILSCVCVCVCVCHNRWFDDQDKERKRKRKLGFHDNWVIYEMILIIKIEEKITLIHLLVFDLHLQFIHDFILFYCRHLNFILFSSPTPFHSINFLIFSTVFSLSFPLLWLYHHCMTHNHENARSPCFCVRHFHLQDYFTVTGTVTSVATV